MWRQALRSAVGQSRAARPARSLRCVAGARCASSASAPVEIEVTATSVRDAPSPKQLLVLGGNGFVGTAVCRAATARGLAVKSLSRSGAPAKPVPGVEYVRGDVFDTTWAANLVGCSAVVSCIGGFGSNEAMRRINGTANEAAIAAAAAAKVPRFVFVSVHEYNLPEFVTGAIGYFQGKRAAERALAASFPDGGVVLKPGFIYGDRVVGQSVLPLGMVGKPLEAALAGALGKLLSPLSAVPGSDVLLAPPVSVEAVAAAAVASAVAEGPVARSLDIAAINALAAQA